MAVEGGQLRVDHDPTQAFEAKLQNIRESRRRRARRRLLTAIAIPVVLLLIGTIFVLTQRNVTTQISLDEATAKFRAEPRAEVDEAASTVAEGEHMAASDEPVDDVGREVGAEPAVAEMFASLPAEGVYAYRANGGEEISVFGAHHRYPERIFSTVRHLGGCRWEQRNDVIEEHVDRRELCNEDGQLLQLLQERQVEFFGKRDGGSMRCDPPALQHATPDEPGTSSSAHCVDTKTGDHATAKRAFIGVRPLTIDGASVDAIHYRVDSTFTGHATGKSRDLFWVSPETGMVLRWDRMVDTLADATFGAQVRYEEEASFVLESLIPKT